MNQVIKKASWGLVRVISLNYLGPEKKEKAQHSRTPNPEQLKAKHPLQLSCKQCLSPSPSLSLCISARRVELILRFCRRNLVSPLYLVFNILICPILSNENIASLVCKSGPFRFYILSCNDIFLAITAGMLGDRWLGNW